MENKWDRPTKVLHLLMIVCFFSLLISAVLIKTLEKSVSEQTMLQMGYFHFYAGVAAIIVVSLRVLWGFFGAEPVRWSNLPAGAKNFWKWARPEIEFVLTGKDSTDRKNTGHNILAIPVYLTALALFIPQALTGVSLLDHLREEAKEIAIKDSARHSRPASLKEGIVFVHSGKKHKKKAEPREENESGHEEAPVTGGLTEGSPLPGQASAVSGHDGDEKEEEESLAKELHEIGIVWLPIFIVAHLSGMIIHRFRGENVFKTMI